MSDTPFTQQKNLRKYTPRTTTSPAQRAQQEKFLLLGTVTGLPSFLANVRFRLGAAKQSTLNFERLCEELTLECKRIEQNIRSTK